MTTCADGSESSKSVCETKYFSACDANYNVLGIVDSAGVLKERYEYTPYGQRTVYFSPGINDTGLYTPLYASRRVIVGAVSQPYGPCKVEHQGLHGDEDEHRTSNIEHPTSNIEHRTSNQGPRPHTKGVASAAGDRARPFKVRCRHGAAR